jgi:hypothetical protein
MVFQIFIREDLIMNNPKKAVLAYLVGFLVIAFLVGKENVPPKQQKVPILPTVVSPNSSSGQTTGTAVATPAPSPTPAATPAPTPVATPTPTPVPTPEPTPEPVSYPTPTPLPISTPEPVTIPEMELDIPETESEFNEKDQIAIDSAESIGNSVKEMSDGFKALKTDLRKNFEEMIDEPVVVALPVRPEALPKKKTAAKSTPKPQLEPVKTVKKTKKEAVVGSNRLVVLGFEDCPSCRTLHQDLEQLDLGGFVVKDIDVQKTSMRGTKYSQYKQFPVIIIENADGETITKMVGYDRKREVSPGLTYQQALVQILNAYDKRKR